MRSFIKRLDTAAPPSLNRYYVAALLWVFLVANALVMLAQLSAGSFIMFILDATAAGLLGYELYHDYRTDLPPDHPVL